MPPALSIIIPVLNEEAHITGLLNSLQTLRARGCELIVVDGGSQDQSVARARARADRVLQTARGRALQMNAGAAVAQGTILWFLHGDSAPPADADGLIQQALADSRRIWGRFDVRLSGNRPLLRVVERLMNLRSRLTGIATGDQGLFVRREAFMRCGGYPAIALMEDIALSRALKRLAAPVCLRMPILTSSRRWETNGVVKTIMLMWRLRLLYFLGVAPERLARIYDGPR